MIDYQVCPAGQRNFCCFCSKAIYEGSSRTNRLLQLGAVKEHKFPVKILLRFCKEMHILFKEGHRSCKNCFQMTFMVF